MYGAILGDMIGSPYEFDQGNKSKVFPLFTGESHFTDDTVMTIAVAEALMKTAGDPDDGVVRQALVDRLQYWGRKYPDAGYGARFTGWLQQEHPLPYGSYGNGSAMRVSAAGWLTETLQETRRLAKLSAEVTHDHPEGIKGAESVASAIYLARKGHDKNDIREYVEAAFDYDLIRTAVSLGGDCDTLTAIAGSIAEAYYGVPKELQEECRKRLDKDLLLVLDGFMERIM